MEVSDQDSEGEDLASALSIVRHQTRLQSVREEAVDQADNGADNPTSNNVLTRVGAEVQATPGDAEDPEEDARDVPRKESGRGDAQVPDEVHGEPNREGDGLKRVRRGHGVVISVTGARTMDESGRRARNAKEVLYHVSKDESSTHKEGNVKA